MNNCQKMGQNTINLASQVLPRKEEADEFLKEVNIQRNAIG
jgi:hypothetical protein